MIYVCRYVYVYVYIDTYLCITHRYRYGIEHNKDSFVMEAKWSVNFPPLFYIELYSCCPNFYEIESGQN